MTRYLVGENTMLTKTAPERPTTTYAVVDHTVVRMVVGLRCPRCRRPLQASDVVADSGAVTLICAGCHHDVLTVEPRS
jgi:hypothetical protein